MKQILPVLSALAAMLALAPAQNATPSAEKPAAVAEVPAAWGLAIDPDGDCQFGFAEGKLTITVPGSARPHDLSSELASTNSPRVLRQVVGDFSIQVKVDGGFAPGTQSTQAGRTPYNGAGLLLIADTNNYVRLERAVLHSGDLFHYTNFEIRVNGNLERIGRTNDRPLKGDAPIFLRVERAGDRVHGYVSEDGEKWEELNSKPVPPEWCHELSVGVAAISTSKAPFSPVFSELKVAPAADAQGK